MVLNFVMTSEIQIFFLNQIFIYTHYRTDYRHSTLNRISSLRQHSPSSTFLVQQWNPSHPVKHSGGSLKLFLQHAAFGPQKESQFPPPPHPAFQHSLPRLGMSESKR